MKPDAMTPEIDPELWIEVEGFDGRCYLIGNGHTFPGRMLLWSESQQVTANVSKDAITGSSEASRRWIDGFLAGNEPSLADFLHIDGATAAELPDDDPRVVRWREALYVFRDQGSMIVGNDD